MNCTRCAVYHRLANQPVYSNCILQLVEHSAPAVTDPVGKYFEDFPPVDRV